MTQRVRGRAGAALRKRQLEAEPRCRDCIARGVITFATAPDHIVPLGESEPETHERDLLVVRMHALIEIAVGSPSDDKFRGLPSLRPHTLHCPDVAHAATFSLR